jgi:predicted DNA-binding transcriptional regulator AlpA
LNTKPKPPPKKTKHFAARADAAASERARTERKALGRTPHSGNDDDEGSDPPKSGVPQRLIDKTELLKRVPVSFPTIWAWMRDGNFPRARNIGGKSAWLEAEVEAWIIHRPVTPIKGDNEKVEA